MTSAGAGGDGFHPHHHVAAVALLRLWVHAIIHVILAHLLEYLEAVHDVGIHAVEAARHRVIEPVCAGLRTGAGD